MKLLIITQKVDQNDDILGFFHDWIKEFAKRCELVTATCLFKGEYHLPENVKVMSLGKETKNFQFSIFNFQLINKLKYTLKFYRYIWQERNNYDAVFVHMNQVYVILGGWLWRLMGKKIGFWYAHGATPFSLKIAEKFAEKIYTSTKGGCRLKSNKINVVGQGINSEIFKPDFSKKKSEVFKIITVGRISPSKDYETLLKAAEVLIKEGYKLKVDIIGAAGIAEQNKYFDDLKKMTKDRGVEEKINFVGAIANKNIIDFLQPADLFVNASHTGSLDKAILEAMAVGLPVLTCNEAAREILKDFAEQTTFPMGDFFALADKIKSIMSMDSNEKEELGKSLREIVVRQHNTAGLINKIILSINQIP